MKAPARERKRDPATWPDEKIEGVVDGIIERREVYDTGMNYAIFGSEQPQWWAQWPRWARDTWDIGAAMYLEKQPVLGRAPYAAKPDVDMRTDEPYTNEKYAPIGVADVWTAFDEANKGPLGGRWAWRDIGFLLGLNDKATAYLVKYRMGFRVEGTPGHRIVAAGPCVKCRQVFRTDELSKAHECRGCQ